jgi:hypothetical protein
MNAFSFIEAEDQSNRFSWRVAGYRRLAKVGI